MLAGGLRGFSTRVLPNLASLAVRVRSAVEGESSLVQTLAAGALVAFFFTESGVARASGEARVTDRTEVRAVSYSGAISTSSYEAETALTGQLELRWPTTKLLVQYGPRFTVRNVSGDVLHEIFQTGRVAAMWRWRTGSIEASEEGSYGQNNFFSLATSSLVAGVSGTTGVTAPAQPSGGSAAPGAAGAAQPVLGGPSTVQYGASRTAVRLTCALSKRWSYELRGTYVDSGGLDEPSRLLLPEARALAGDAALRYRLSLRSEAVTSVSAAATSFDAGESTTLPSQRFLLLTASERLEHRLARRTQLAATAGIAAVADASAAEGRAGTALYPYLEASLASALGPLADGTDVFAHGRFSPEPNRLTGTVEGRALADAGVGVQRGKVRFESTVSGTSTVDAEHAGSFMQVLGSVLVRYRPVNALAFEVGARLSWQHVGAAPGLAATSVGTQGLFGAVVLRSPAARF